MTDMSWGVPFLKFLCTRGAPAGAVAALLFFPGSPFAQTLNWDTPPADKPFVESYVIDSKGVTYFRNGVRQCVTACLSPGTPDKPIQIRAKTSGRASELTWDTLPSGDHRRVSVSPKPLGQPIAKPVPPRGPVPLHRTAVPAPPFGSVATPGPVVVPIALADDRAAGSQPVKTARSQKVSQANKPGAAPNLQPEKKDGLTKEQKALLLNAGAVVTILSYGAAKWDYFQASPRARSEGWFGRTTKHGGADKLGHFWTSYALSHLFSYIYRWWDYSDSDANGLGALSSLGLQSIMELGDSFTGRFGFSYEDFISNIAGVGAAYVLGRYPDLARKIDFRVEYRPESFDDIKDDPFTDYDNQRYLVVLKLDGFDAFNDTYLSYLELQAGYFTRGFDKYDPGEPDDRRRNLFFGVGFNVSKLVQQFVNFSAFDYVQLPYTSVGATKGLD